MTEKRFYTDGQYVMQDREVYVICNGKHNADVVATALNELLTEKEQLKQAYQTLKHRHSLLHDVCIEAECDRDSYHKDVVSLEKENEQLKKELTKFKELEKYVGDVKREELDRVFKMSIYEIAEGFQYYQERIKELETVIQQILYETRANHTKGEYSIIVSVSPQMHDKLSNLIMKRMW